MYFNFPRVLFVEDRNMKTIYSLVGPEVFGRRELVSFQPNR
jgi:hypothetical protein